MISRLAAAQVQCGPSMAPFATLAAASRCGDSIAQGIAAVAAQQRAQEEQQAEADTLMPDQTPEMFLKVFLTPAQCQQAFDLLEQMPQGPARHRAWPYMLHHMDDIVLPYYRQPRLQDPDTPLEQRYVWLLLIVLVAEQLALTQGFDAAVACHNRSVRRMLLEWAGDSADARKHLALLIIFIFGNTFGSEDTHINVSPDTLLMHDEPGHQGTLADAAKSIPIL